MDNYSQSFSLEICRTHEAIVICMPQIQPLPLWNMSILRENDHPDGRGPGEIGSARPGGIAGPGPVLVDVPKDVQLERHAVASAAQEAQAPAAAPSQGLPPAWD